MPNLDFLLESRKIARDPQIQALMQAVVRVEADNRGGTGFNVSPDGLIVTNDHITDGAEQVDVSFQSDRKQYTVGVLLADPRADLALLALEEERLPYLDLESVSLPEQGDEVLLIGNPLGFFRIVTRAVVLGFTWQEGRDSPVLVLDGPVYKGNSGSPVINADGRVIGVVYASTTGTESGKTAALAIPSAEIVGVIDRIQASSVQP